MDITNRFLLLGATLPAIAVLVVYFLRARPTTSTPALYFLIAWFYYGFSVPLDLIIGFRPNDPWLTTDFQDPSITPDLLYSVFLYHLVVIGFLLTYPIAFSTTLRRQKNSLRALTPPPFLFVAGLITISLFFALSNLELGTRMERSLEMRDSGYGKFIGFVQIATLALASLYILYTKSSVRRLVIVAFILLVTITQGDRSLSGIPIIALFCAMQRRTSIRQVAIVAFSAFILFWVWKPVYGTFTAENSSGANIIALAWENTADLSFSSIDASASFGLLVGIVTGDIPYEIQMGSTFFFIPLILSLPRFLFAELWNIEIKSLSESFVKGILPEIWELGGGRGFGAVAEAQINVPLLGPLLFGMICGLIFALVRDKGGPAVQFIAILVALRIFRSDFASLIKINVILMGGTMYLSYLLSWAINKRNSPGPWRNVTSNIRSGRRSEIPTDIRTKHEASGTTR